MLYRPRKAPLAPEHFSRVIERELYNVPLFVVIDVARSVNQIACMFDSSIEFILDAIIEALSDRVMKHHHLRMAMRRFVIAFEETPDYSGHLAFDRLVTIEQNALDMADYLEAQKMYLYGRYLPYQFETLMEGGTILLKRYEDFQAFTDRIGTELGFNEGEQEL